MLPSSRAIETLRMSSGLRATVTTLAGMAPLPSTRAVCVSAASTSTFSSKMREDESLSVARRTVQIRSTRDIGKLAKPEAMSAMFTRMPIAR